MWVVHDWQLGAAHGAHCRVAGLMPNPCLHAAHVWGVGQAAQLGSTHACSQPRHGTQVRLFLACAGTSGYWQVYQSNCAWLAWPQLARACRWWMPGPA